jgi:hypothetical protein
MQPGTEALQVNVEGTGKAALKFGVWHAVDFRLGN